MRRTVAVGALVGVVVITGCDAASSLSGPSSKAQRTMAPVAGLTARTLRGRKHSLLLVGNRLIAGSKAVELSDKAKRYFERMADLDAVLDSAARQIQRHHVGGPSNAQRVPPSVNASLFPASPAGPASLRPSTHRNSAFVPRPHATSDDYYDFPSGYDSTYIPVGTCNSDPQQCMDLLMDIYNKTPTYLALKEALIDAIWNVITDFTTDQVDSFLAALADGTADLASFAWDAWGAYGDAVLGAEIIDYEDLYFSLNWDAWLYGFMGGWGSWNAT